MSEKESLRGWVANLYERHGFLTPEIVKEAARPEDSPAHGFVFNVPAEEAAEAYYLDRAHELIRRVRVRIEVKPDEPPRAVRVYYAVPGEDTPYVYYSDATLVANPDKAAAAETEAVRRLNQAAAALEDLRLRLAAGRRADQTTVALGLVRQARDMVSAAADD